MDTDNAAVNHQVFQARITGNGLKNLLPDTFMGPTVITDIDTMPVTIFRRQVTPGRTSTGNPEKTFKKQTVILCCYAAITGFAWKQWGNTFPLVVS